MRAPTGVAHSVKRWVISAMLGPIVDMSSGIAANANATPDAMLTVVEAKAATSKPPPMGSATSHERRSIGRVSSSGDMAGSQVTRAGLCAMLFRPQRTGYRRNTTTRDGRHMQPCSPNHTPVIAIRHTPHSRSDTRAIRSRPAPGSGPGTRRNAGDRSPPLAVVTEGVVTFTDGLTPPDLGGPRHEVQPLLGMAGDAVEDEPEEPAGVGLVLVTSHLVQ